MRPWPSRVRTNVLLLVIGPCSSDNEEAVLDYAHRLAKLQEEVKVKNLYYYACFWLNHVLMEMVIRKHPPTRCRG